MDLIEIIWDLSQQGSINQHEQQIASTEVGLRVVHERIRELQLRTINLANTCQVLCDILINRLGIPQDELQKAIESQLSANSIKASGNCPACGHKFRAGRATCLYCGFKPNAEP